MFSDPKFHFRTEVRSYHVIKTFLFFKKNQSLGDVEPQEGLENVPDILTQNFLEIRILSATGEGLDQKCSARLFRAKMDNFFLRIVNAGEQTCWCAADKMS